MLKIELNKKNLTVISAVVVFLFILTVFFYLPLLGEIRRKALERGALNNQLTIAGANLDTLRKANVSKKLISRQEVSSVIDNITREGRALLLNFKSMSQKEIISAPDNHAILPVEMEIEGDYKQLGLFFGALENIKDAIITVDSFRITGDEKASPKVSAALTVNMHLAQ